MTFIDAIREASSEASVAAPESTRLPENRETWCDCGPENGEDGTMVWNVDDHDDDRHLFLDVEPYLTQSRQFDLLFLEICSGLD